MALNERIGAESRQRGVVEGGGAAVEGAALHQGEHPLDVIVLRLQALVVPRPVIAQPAALPVGRLAAVELHQVHVGLPRKHLTLTAPRDTLSSTVRDDTWHHAHLARLGRARNAPADSVHPLSNTNRRSYMSLS